MRMRDPLDSTFNAAVTIPTSILFMARCRAGRLCHEGEEGGLSLCCGCM